jgi:hypothetical protein
MIRDSLAAAVARRADLISAQQLAPGAWTELFVVGPYTPSASIQRCFRHDQSVNEHDIAERDDITLLICRFPDGRLESRPVPRSVSDFGPDAWSARYSETRRSACCPATPLTVRALRQ